MGRLATLARSRPGRAVSRRLDRNLAARRLALRLGVWEPRGADVPPETPVGIKLELTARCNLKCPFCYTDSPRQTQAKATSLGDDQWRAVVDDAVEAGIIEAVVTGGEPLLRSALTLELLDTLASSGVGTTLNTNGWFVDDTVADRLASVAGLQVNISVDGASPALHDGARGAAGSWERAIGGADRLLARGVRVRLIHVVTPANAAEVEHMLEHAWLLGAGSMRVTRVGLLGAASRGGDWDVPSSRLHAAVRRFRERRGEAMPVTVNTATAAGLAALEGVAPAALLVRPNGAVRIDSLSPFSFGSVPEERLSDCWERVVSTWPHPAVVAWARSITTAEGIATSGHVPYRDEEVELAPGPGAVDGPAQVREDRIPPRFRRHPRCPVSRRRGSGWSSSRWRAATATRRAASRAAAAPAATCASLRVGARIA
jgi:MoaA/NifB/PqqE/SkfB family radical SAM enzyme